MVFFFSSRRRHTRLRRDWSSDVCSSDLRPPRRLRRREIRAFEGVVMVDLSGRTAFVTGGGRGIGASITTTLAEAGADVAINYRRDEDAANETADAVRAFGRSEERRGGKECRSRWAPEH